MNQSVRIDQVVHHLNFVSLKFLIRFVNLCNFEAHFSKFLESLRVLYR